MEYKDIKTEVWPESYFFQSHHSWNQLLKASKADRLFLSWEWMHTWWNIWGNKKRDELYLVAAYIDGELVGIAPLYKTTTYILKKLIPVRRIEFMGCRYQLNSGLRTEYLQFICKTGYEQLVNQAILEHIKADSNWDESIFTDISDLSLLTDQVLDSTQKSGYVTRDLSEQSTFSVETSGDFDSYSKSLGKNTRLKLLGRRKLLDKMGNVRLQYATKDNIEELLSCINTFHADRFHSDAFSARHIELLKTIANYPGYTYCHTSALRLNEEIISVIVNLSTDNKVYNIQLGFKDNFDKRISLGTLHLGYAIEAAYLESNITNFDLLAGPGKNSNYKTRIALPEDTLKTTQVVRNKLLKTLYYLNDKFKPCFTVKHSK